jgi:hypothetical protein
MTCHGNLPVRPIIGENAGKRYLSGFLPIMAAAIISGGY